MKPINVVLLFAAVVLLIFAATGCTTTETLAAGISQKSISGSGAFGYSRVGLDTTTQTPELVSLFVWGDYTSVVPGDEVFRLEEVEDASIFNSSAVTRRRKVFFATGDKKRMDAVIAKIAGKNKSAGNNGNEQNTAGGSHASNN